MKRITITIPENYLEHLEIHFGDLELSTSKQISLALRGFIEKVIKKRNQPLSIGGPQ